MKGAVPFRETDALLDPELRAGLAEIARDEEDARKGMPRLTRLSDVEPEAVEWLWPGRLPLGKISLLEGDPGLGKSTVGVDLAADAGPGADIGARAASIVAKADVFRTARGAIVRWRREARTALDGALAEGATGPGIIALATVWLAQVDGGLPA